MSAQLLPNVIAKFFDDNGDPLSGGKVYTYENGTSTPKATYTDASEGTPNANPVILDSRGEASIWLTDGTYKLIVKDSDDNTISTINDVAKLAQGDAGLSFRVGSGAPSSGLGINGDTYLDQATGTLYTKSSGSWSSIGSVTFPVAAEDVSFDNTDSSLTATDVQEAIDEVEGRVDTLEADTGLSDHLNDTSDAHDASAISVTPNGNMAATDAQAALQEHQGDIDALNSGLTSAESDIDDLELALPAGDDYLQIQEQNPAPTSPGSGYHRIYAKNDGKIYRKNSSGTETELGAGSGGGTTGIITGDDSNADTSIGNWLAYADAAATIPVDGTGGTPTTTVTRTTSSPLNGDGSILITKDAANRQGEGASVTKSVAPKFRGKPCELLISYEASANFDFGTYLDPSDPSDVCAFLYDATNGVLLQPNPIFLDGSGIYRGVVQIPSTCASIRVIAHIATTNALAWTLKLDDVELDIASNVSSPAVSDPVSYTPTLVGFGTVTNSNFKYHIEGAFLVIEGYFTTGTRTAVEAQLPLPTGYVVSSNSPSPIALVGEAGWDGDTPTSYTLLATPGDTFLNFGSQDSGSAIAPINGSSIFGNSTNVALKAKVRVQGATSGYAHPAAVMANMRIAVSATKSSGTVAADTTVPSWTETEDTSNSFDASTGVFTVPSPGDYDVFFHPGYSATGAAIPYVAVNGTERLRGAHDVSTTSSAIVSGPITGLVRGDLVTFRHTSNSKTYAAGTYMVIIKRQSNHIYALPDKVQTKCLSSDLTADTNPISDLTFTGLTIGKVYELQMRPYLNVVDTNSGFLYAIHNGVTIGTVRLRGTGSGSVTGIASLSAPVYFTASATTLTFQFDESNVATLSGDGTAAQTYVVLKELNNTVQYSGW